MSVPGQQKKKLFYLCKILHEKTDEDHPLSAAELCNQLKRYGITAERKSIYSDIEILMDCGYDIISTRAPRQGYFMGQRDFEVPEVRLLMDAVQSSRFIPEKKTQELLDKLSQLVSLEEGKALRQQSVVTGRPKATNDQVYYAIDCLHRAISRKKRVSFQYFTIGPDKKSHPRRDGKPYFVSPYALLWKDDCYYLVGNTEGYDNLSHYRVDRMESVEMLDEPSRSFEEVSDYQGVFDTADYARKAPSMIAGDAGWVTLRFSHEYVQHFLDRFGMNATLANCENGQCLMTVSAVEGDGLLAWLMHFGADVEIVSPESLRERMRQQCRALLELYGPDRAQ